MVGEIQALVADQTVRITADHDRIAVDLRDLRAGRTILRSSGERGQRARAIARTDKALRLADLTAIIRLGGRTVARLGKDARPGLLSRLLRIAPLEVRVSDLIVVVKAMWRRG